jgi:hypothetical protein
MNLRQILLTIIIFTGKLAAGVTVWFPDTTAAPQIEIRMPLYVESVQVADSIVAYDCSVEYDSQILTLQRISEQGSITGKWGPPFANFQTGRCTVAGFTANLPDQRLIDSTNVWLYFDFWVEGEPAVTTEIRITHFQLYSLEGELPIDSVSIGHIEIVMNYPPVISPFPGANILEDDSLIIQIDQYISDADDDWHELTIEFQAVPFAGIVLDSTGLLHIIPVPDWSGQLTLPFQVTDPHGAFSQGELELQVISVPDPPMPFQLTSPNDTTLIREAEVILFEWDPSENVDSDDQVSYRFLLSQDSLFQSLQTIIISDLSENRLSMNRLLPAGHYYWKVLAQDQQGLSQWCQQPCSFDIQESSRVRTLPAFLFKLQQNYPNPFNAETAIAFQLDREREVCLKIIDSGGRLIRTIINGHLDAGSYRMSWDGTDQQGIPVNSGIYNLVLSSQARFISRKLIIIK